MCHPLLLLYPREHLQYILDGINMIDGINTAVFREDNEDFEGGMGAKCRFYPLDLQNPPNENLVRTAIATSLRQIVTHSCNATGRGFRSPCSRPSFDLQAVERPLEVSVD